MFTSWQVDAKSDAWVLALDRCFDIPPPQHTHESRRARMHGRTDVCRDAGVWVCTAVLVYVVVDRTILEP